MNDLPAPLTPPDCDLQAFPFMPLHVARLRDSDLAAREHPTACWYAVLLWSASWHQIPAASLPDDDVVLARLCGLGRDLRSFRKFRDGSLRGFVKCADGRLYHPIVAEQALEAWSGRTEFKEKKSAAAERQERWRIEQRAMSARLRELSVTPPEKASKAALRALLAEHDPRYAEDWCDGERNGPDNAEPPVTGRHSVTAPVTPVTPKKGTGTGTGTGTGILEEEDAYASGEKPVEEFKLDLPQTDPAPPALLPEHVVEAWNAMAVRHGLARVVKLTDARRAALKTRIAQHPIEDFLSAIAAVERSSFCLGVGKDGWKADFDFLLQPSSFVKLIEGSYDRG